MATTNRIWTVSEDWDSTASLSNLLQCLTTLTIKKSMILFLHWNGIFCIWVSAFWFCPFTGFHGDRSASSQTRKDAVTESVIWLRADLDQPEHWRILDSRGLSLPLTGLVAIHSPFSCKAPRDLSWLLHHYWQAKLWETAVIDMKPADTSEKSKIPGLESPALFQFSLELEVNRKCLS